MELLQLKYFCSAAETENFSKTAKEFSVPPSNISQSIKRLEKELNAKFFNRCSNRLFLNDDGREFYTKIKNALNIIESAKAPWIEKRKNIKICITTNRRIVMETAEKFRLLHPDCSFEISHKLSEDISAYDLIIADDSINSDKLIQTLIISENICVALPKDSPLAQKEYLCTEDLKNQIFISMNKESNLFRAVQKICTTLEFKPNIAISSDDPFYIRKCVELGLGIAFVPVFSWKGMFSDKIVLKSIGNFSRNTYAFRNTNRYCGEYTESFLDMLTKECKSH